jgi:hypothetical protein
MQCSLLCDMQTQSAVTNLKCCVSVEKGRENDEKR